MAGDTEPEGRGRFVVDLRDGTVFEPLRVQVWPGGDPRGMINEHVVAAFAVDPEVVEAFDQLDAEELAGPYRGHADNLGAAA